jgi:hypothetical protein
MPVKQRDLVHVTRNYSFNGQPIGSSWIPPKAIFVTPGPGEGEVLGFYGSYPFAVRPETWEAVRPELQPYCEVLPVMTKDETFLIIHVTQVVDCLNTKLSYPEAHSPYYGKYVFQPKELRGPLFKIPETKANEVLCVEGLEGVGQDFRAMVKKHKLRGLTFEKLWSGG